MASNSTFESSSIKTKDDLLNEILVCGICLCRLTSPCCLPCAHSFCRSCLLDYARNNNNNNNINSSILCPYCKYEVNFQSFEHFESLLIINPILKQLCEVLETSKSTSNSSNGTYSARCHSCCLLKMLKVCKHCYFMLCDTCRRTHLLDVHRESKVELEILESYLQIINKKRLQMDEITKEYDEMRDHIRNYTNQMIENLEQQRDEALQIIDERQHANDEMFWTRNGFDNGEKLDFFVSLAEIAKRKLSAKNITDKDLMELSDNLQTIPDVSEDLIESIEFSKLNLQLDQTIFGKELIRVYENKLTPTTVKT